MKKNRFNNHSLEVLESRIAPANVPAGAVWLPAGHSLDGSPTLVEAGQGLSTAGEGGDYLLYVAKGRAWVFTTDLNNNNLVDFNEITGIAAGDGLRLISFVDIHGDIVTNLKETQTSSTLVLSLSDSNNNSADDPQSVRGDGRVVLNNRIEAIEMRTLTTADIGDQNGDLVVNEEDVDFRRAPSTHSIFGNIYAGGGFGVPGDPTSGLLIDSTIITNFGFETAGDVKPMIGSIRVGTAVSGEYFSFGVTGGFDLGNGNISVRQRVGVVLGDDVQGYLLPFVPSPGQAGASIAYVRSAADSQQFNLNGLFAGNGGANAPGGSVYDVTINGDDSGGYDVVAGNGGSGLRGGQGGSIIRFTDVNSDTSEVILRSGSGGNGTTGVGGGAGSTEILEANFYGNYSLIFGDGGNGFTAGGAGAGLTRAVIEQVTTVGATSGSGWGTSHNPEYYNQDPTTSTVDVNGQPVSKYEANLGTTEAIDINGDGVGDFVYSTNGVSQLVVMFGNPNAPGTFLPQRIYLDSPRNAEAITVADLNGDGHADIAAGSSDAGNQSGVAVYLAKWDDVNKDGDVIDAEDQFLGFWSPRYSVLPQLESGDPALGTPELGFWQGTQQVTQLVAGDFDGDGANELAVMITQHIFRTHDEDTGVTTALSQDRQVLLFLTPDRELDTNTDQWFFTGQFYADFGTKEVTAPNNQVAPAQPLLPFFGGFNVRAGALLISPTALSTTSTHDVIMMGEITKKVMFSVDNFTPSLVGPLQGAEWAFGRVDTDRRNGEVSPADFTLRDFALMDFDDDNNVDAVAVSDSPANFIIGMKGDGLGGATQDSGNGGDQSGFYSDNKQFRGVKAADGDGDGIVNDFVIMYQQDNNSRLDAYEYRPGPSTALAGPTLTGVLTEDIYINSRSVLAYHSGGLTDSILFDMYYPNPDDQSTDAMVGALGADRTPRYMIFENFLSLTSPVLWFEDLAQPQINIIGGDGGDAFVGKGGNGGALGGKGRLQTTIVDPVNNITLTEYVGAIEISFEGGPVRLQAGDGGIGFSRGGNGGGVLGVTLRDPNPGNTVVPVASVVAGNGGVGVSGTGGAGGDLLANSLFNAQTFFAGNGGDGKFGGRGGSVVGNQLSIGVNRVYDTLTAFLDVVAGAGGNGIRSGGAGGSIQNFLPDMDGTPGRFIDSGMMRYVAGNGGAAVSGVGGVGGSIVNSSPELNAVVEREILLQAGHGGDGRTGGAGGNVSKFVVNYGGAVTRVAGVLAGHGGDGTAGPGGKGGSILGVDVKTAGSSTAVAFTSPDALAFFTYTRFLAGDGGQSSGNVGGAGGTINGLITSATQGSVVIVGGAGGSGLTRGGAGGDVLNATLQALGAGSNKALVIAGAGGDARSFIPHPGDPTPNQAKKAFGGKIGIGGNGGNISGFKQFGSPGAHMDFIAGNGGSTIHYGIGTDPKTYVGKGGSVMNIDIQGAAGNMSPTAAIVGYNDVDAGETVQDFVQSRLRIGETLLESFGDNDGNVGIVVGAAGRNKSATPDDLGSPYDYISQPAKNAVNGSLVNFRGFGIMAAVAGSVDRLAEIQLAKNVVVQGTLVGTDKGTVGVREFIDIDGTIVSAPVRDGRLLDGALIAKSVTPPLNGVIVSF